MSPEEAYNNGYQAGCSDTKATGLDLVEAYDEGYSRGFDAGWESGYEEGYSKGADQL